MNTRLRIGLLTHSVRARGGVVHTLELAQALVERGHTVTVMASAEPGEQLFREVDFPVQVLRLPHLTGDLEAQVAQRIDTLVQGLPPLLNAGRYDVLHAQDSLSGNALALLRRQGMALPPWVRTVHHLDVFQNAILMAWQERAWRAADGVACVSELWTDHFREVLGHPARRMHNGVNLGRYRMEPTAGDGERLAALGLAPQAGPVCLLVGGVEQRKNSVRLLQAFAQLRRSEPAWASGCLVVVGGASMLDHSAAQRAWVHTLAENGLREGPGQPVLRTGTVPDELLPALMRRATVVAMPSLMEGFGLAALEGLACGTPVLVSRRPPFTEHFATSPGVAWCDPEDTSSIAAGLQGAACMPRLTITPQVCLDHSWGRSAALHEAWYVELLAARQTTADLESPTFFN
jgi:glycosyltransferase-like protein